MKYLAWLLKAAFFFTLFAFALNNLDAVQVHLFFGASWQAPLVLVLLASFALGIFLGMALILPLWIKARQVASQAPKAPAVNPEPPPTVPAPPDVPPNAI